MKVEKRDHSFVNFNINKIECAIKNAFKDSSCVYDEKTIREITNDVCYYVNELEYVSVEKIQDIIEYMLLVSYPSVAKSFIIYREKRSQTRKLTSCILDNVSKPLAKKIEKLFMYIEKNYDEKYSLDVIIHKFNSIFNNSNINDDNVLDTLVKGTVELTSMNAPEFEKISALFLNLKYKNIVKKFEDKNKLHTFYDKIKFLTEKGLYSDKVLKTYTKDEIDSLSKLINNKNDLLFNYSGLDLLYKRYVIKTHDGHVVESLQEMFLGIAMFLAMNDKAYVRDFYNVLSQLKITVATPTLANARKPHHQLSSCFIDTVPDSLDGIYQSLDNFAKVSGAGGGMGMYLGKVRASGSDIRGFKGASGGIIRWIKLINDTAVAVDQLGVRQGAVAVYLDIWHSDLREFLQLKTNNGDDRMKAHDIFPALCVPNYFWEQVKNNINGNWYLMCPHEIRKFKGFSLEDYFGDEWKDKYIDCLQDERITKHMIKIKDLIRLILKSAVETGTPFIFNRDLINEANPNSHVGNIYSSNLCTEIAQNMSEIKHVDTSLDKDNNLVRITKPGDFVVCNLASLTLGRIDVNSDDLENTVKTVIRMLDNVIDLNRYPLQYAKLTSNKYRAIGLGVSGYHHMLANNGIKWETQEHLDFVDKIFERINYAAIKASNELALEKGSYSLFDGSDWQTGKYFEKRGYTSDKWQELKKKVSQGMRNAYLLAVAPTGSTSIISGTTAGVDPIMNKYFLEEKKGSMLPRVAPDLSAKTMWLYKNAHHINQEWSIKACGVRQRHIDQAQSFNLYITNQMSLKQVLNLYLKAYENGVKTIYYVRSKSLEVEECESCSA